MICFNDITGISFDFWRVTELILIPTATGKFYSNIIDWHFLASQGPLKEYKKG